MLYRVFETENSKVKDPIYFSTSFDNADEAFKWFKDMTECYKSIKQTKEQLETKAQDKSQTTDTFTDKPVFFNTYSYILSIQRWYYLIRPPPLVQCIIMLYLIVFILSLWENLYIA